MKMGNVGSDENPGWPIESEGLCFLQAPEGKGTVRLVKITKVCIKQQFFKNFGSVLVFSKFLVIFKKFKNHTFSPVEEEKNGPSESKIKF